MTTIITYDLTDSFEEIISLNCRKIIANIDKIGCADQECCPFGNWIHAGQHYFERSIHCQHSTCTCLTCSSTITYYNIHIMDHSEFDERFWSKPKFLRNEYERQSGIREKHDHPPLCSNSIRTFSYTSIGIGDRFFHIIHIIITYLYLFV